MALNARDLFFILRARDEASSTLRGVSRDLLRMGASAEAASARAEAARLRQLAATMRASGATKAQTDAVLANAAAWEQEARRIEDSARSHERMSKLFQDVGHSLMISGVALIGIGSAVGAALMSTVSAAVNYGKQVALTKTQVDGFSASLDDLGQMGKDVATSIAVPFEQIQPALYNIFSSTNANLEQSRVLLTAFAKAAVAGSVDIEQASKGTMTILNGFGLPLSKVNDVLDIQFQLVRKGVGTYSDFNGVLGRIIPSANAAGQNFQTVAAMLAFMTRNGQSAAMSATAGARALDAFANPIAQHNMEQLGIKVRDAAGFMLPLSDILTQLRAKILALPPADRIAALTEVFKGAGGTIQAMRFIKEVIDPMNASSTQLQAFLGFLGDMQNATGQFGDAYALMAGTTASKTQLLKNNWDVLKVSVGQLMTPYLASLVGWLDKILQFFNQLPHPIQDNIVKFIGLGAAFSIASGTALVLAGALSDIIGMLIAAGIDLAPALLIVAGVGAALTGIGVGAYQLVQNLRASASPISDAKNNMKGYGTATRDAGDNTIYLNDGIMGAMPNMSGFSGAIRDTTDNTILFNDSISKAKPAVSSFNGEVDRIKSTFSNVRDLFKDIGRDVTEVWNNDFKPFFVGVQSDYNQYLKPTFDDLWDKLNNKVIPASKDFWDNFYTKHKGDIQELLTTFREIIKDGFMALAWIINNIWMPIMRDLSGLYKDHKKGIDDIKDALEWCGKEIIKFGGGGVLGLLISQILLLAIAFGILLFAIDAVIVIVKAIGAAFSWLWDNVIHPVWDGIIWVLYQIGHVIVLVVGWVWDFVTWLTHRWNHLWLDIVAAAQNALNAIPNLIRMAFSNLGTMLYNAGRNLMNGFINGIRDSLPSLNNILHSITASLPLEKGPPSVDAVLLKDSGRLVMSGFINGIRDMRPSLDRELHLVTAKMAPTVNANITQGSTVLTGSALSNAPVVHKTITNNITVNQAGRNARELAQDLGNALAGRS